MEKQYAQALFNLLHRSEEDSEQLFAKLEAHLDTVGRTKLLPHIYRELHKLETAEERQKESIEIAREADRNSATVELTSLGIVGEPVVNPSLITGWRAKGNGSLIDHSGKRALLDLYQQITTSH